MNNVQYKYILYIIVFVILSTIGIQVYWNYKNYLNNKQHLINDVKVSLDKAVDDYYANLAERSTLGFALESSDSGTILNHSEKLDSIIRNLNNSSHQIDSINVKLMKGVAVFMEPKTDSLVEFEYREHNGSNTNRRMHDLIAHIQPDSLNADKFKRLTSKVVISLASDSLSLTAIDTLFKADLLRKHIDIDYHLIYKGINNSKRTYGTLESLDIPIDSTKAKHLLMTTSESTFLPRGSTLSISFTNETQIILKRILGGILISFLLVLAVISILFYLLHIIKHQKQLAEVKNDLISNITHEFKTPIATIGVAIESIKDFNIIADKDKTKKYLELSTGQLTKLNLMVEKLLETAILDSEDLSLDKESTNIVEVVKTIVEKHHMQTESKTIAFFSPSDSILANVDVFHFENAVNNVLDNAIKYGGNDIKVAIEQSSSLFTISVSDTGNSITKANRNKIFEKFYRIPKGNTHDIKGFGIGLYYTKKIVEKHGGFIRLELDDNLTTFKLSFPNG